MGSGVIALGLWNTIRIVLILIYSPQTLITQELAGNRAGIVGIAVLLALFALVVVILLSIFLYVGKRARDEGLGKKRSPFYIAVIVLLAITHFFSFIYSGSALIGIITIEEVDVLSLVVSMIVDATAAITLAEMCWSAVMLRIYGKKNTGKG